MKNFTPNTTSQRTVFISTVAEEGLLWVSGSYRKDPFFFFSFNRGDNEDFYWIFLKGIVNCGNYTESKRYTRTFKNRGKVKSLVYRVFSIRQYICQSHWPEKIFSPSKSCINLSWLLLLTNTHKIFIIGFKSYNLVKKKTF